MGPLLAQLPTQLPLPWGLITLCPTPPADLLFLCPRGCRQVGLAGLQVLALKAVAASATIHQPLGKLFPVPETLLFPSAKKSWAAGRPGSLASSALPPPSIKPNAGGQGLWGDLASAGVTGGRLGPNRNSPWTPKLQFHMICTPRKSLLVFVPCHLYI